MNPISLLLRVGGFAAVVVLTACGTKEKTPAAATPSPSPSVAGAPSAAAPGATSPSLELTTSTQEAGPAPLSATAPFYSERFLPPDQRIERRQSRIRAVLDPESTAPAPAPQP